jgi:hypothetical protein
MQNSMQAAAWYIGYTGSATDWDGKNTVFIPYTQYGIPDLDRVHATYSTNTDWDRQSVTKLLRYLSSLRAAACTKQEPY